MISFFTDQPLVAGAEVALEESAVAHARARRIAAGEWARLLNGSGSIATGTVLSMDKRRVLVRLADVTRVERPPRLELFVPVADKDRMLWAAEKCAELQATRWQPVFYARSRSVTPRGEGPRFREKVQARMKAALEQSGGAWLPEVAEEVEFEDAIRRTDPAIERLLLDSQGTSIQSPMSNKGIALAIGPEGGFEESERASAIDAGWRPVSLGRFTLRFETAIIAAVAVVRSAQSTGGG